AALTARWSVTIDDQRTARARSDPGARDMPESGVHAIVTERDKPPTHAKRDVLGRAGCRCRRQGERALRARPAMCGNCPGSGVDDHDAVIPYFAVGELEDADGVVALGAALGRRAR